MTGSQRRLLLHAGMGKTGSSALQTAFVQNRDLLASSGVLYPPHPSDEVARSGGVTSGNGTRLRRWLAPRGDVPARQGDRLRARLLEELDTPGMHTLLYSSEFLYLALPERLEELRRHLERHDAHLQVVVYVRNVAEHALSSYSQVVKRSLFTGTFSDYIDPATAGGYHLPLDRVLALPEVLGSEKVTVLHYDSLQYDLVGHFCRQLLGLDASAQIRTTPTVNRALTSLELELMRQLNRVLVEKAQARQVSDALLALPPLGQGGPVLTARDLATLQSTFARQVEAINRQFFRTQTLVVCDEEMTPVMEDPPIVESLTAREEAMLRIVARLTEG